MLFKKKLKKAVKKAEVAVDRQKEAEELGKKLQNFYDSGYVNRKQAFWFAFLKGILGGLGSVVGATVAIALILWILSGLDQVPFVGHLSESVRDTLQRRH
jgi:hypothetical protein